MKSLSLSAGLLALLLPATAYAADDCAPLQLVSSIQLSRTPGSNTDLIPVTVNGVPEKFLFDTGGFLTQLGRPVADLLHLPVRQGNTTLYDMRGIISRDEVPVHSFSYGNLAVQDKMLPVSPNIGRNTGTDAYDGIFAPDYLLRYDIDLDFGDDALKFYAKDHCENSLPAGQNGTAIPFSFNGRHITIPVTLDGHTIRANVDTGATDTLLREDLARYVFGLKPGTADTPDNGVMDGDPSLKTYAHVFKNLSFGNITLENQRLIIGPNAMGRNLGSAQLVGDRAKTERDLVNAPELVIGMDILRRMHVTILFSGNEIYFSPASKLEETPQLAVSPAQTQTQLAGMPRSQAQGMYRDFAKGEIAKLDKQLQAEPDDFAALNDRCYIRAAAKMDLEAALADCDRATKLRPGQAGFLDSLAFVLYQLGRYPEALAEYDKALALNPNLAASLFMRGLTKGKLGDQPGKDADIAAAKTGQPDIELGFKPFDIAE